MTEAPADDIENVDAERALLGLILNDDRLLWEVTGRLTPDDFGEIRNRIIFVAIGTLTDQGRSIAAPILAAQVAPSWGDFSPSAKGYISAIKTNAPTGTNVADLVEAILHVASRRRLVEACNAIFASVTSVSLDTSVEELKAEAVRLIEATDSSVPDQAQPMSLLISQVLTDANAVMTGERPRGIKSGLKCFDDLVGAMLPGNLIVLGGETGSGKTALATVIGVKVAEQGIPVHITSMEQDGVELAARTVAAYSGFTAEDITNGALTNEQMEKVFDRSGAISGLPIWIDSAPSQSVKTMQSRIGRSQIRHGVKLAIIDHLQFAKPEKSRGKEHEEIRQVVDDIKAMAKRLKIPVILISHVHRVTDTWTVKTAQDIRRPLLRDLYGSSAIEKAADGVIFVHRPQWFLERASPGKQRPQWEADMARWAGKAELVLPKRRGGKGFGVRECTFNESVTWFSD